MFKYFINLSIILIFNCGILHGQDYNWFVSDPDLPTAARFDDISFVTPYTGWAVNSSGEIWHTSNGGESWDRQLQISGYFRSVKFADTLNGWAGTLDSTQLLFHTTNGGNNWLQVTNIPTSPVSPKRICGLYVVSKNIIYGSGAFDGPPVIIKTTDGGINWKSIDMRNYATNLIDCYFINKDSGFVVGGSPNALFNGGRGTTKVAVLFTTDGGNSWQTKYTGQTESEWGWKIDFPSSRIGYVSVENFNSGSILKTTDGGQNWTKYDVPDLHDLEGIGFINETTGWVGSRQFTKGYNAEITTDGGFSWQTTNVGEHLNRFQFFGDTLAYAAGITIYKYSKQNITSVIKDHSKNNSFFLSQNYPNPFNPSTTIEYSLPKSENVLIRIYDGLGKELRTILSEYQQKGTHRVMWDGMDANSKMAASGFYIYRIDAGTHAESKMMLLLK